MDEVLQAAQWLYQHTRDMEAGLVMPGFPGDAAPALENFNRVMALHEAAAETHPKPRCWRDVVAELNGERGRA